MFDLRKTPVIFDVGSALKLLEARCSSLGVNLHWATRFMFLQPRFRKSLISGGLMMLLCPPLGWIVALGYRSILLNNFIDQKMDESDLQLPESWLHCLGQGLKAVAVIYSYYVPVLSLFLWFGAGSASEVLRHPLQVSLLFCAIPLFLPVCMLAVPWWYWQSYDWLHFDLIEGILLFIAFAVTTFIMPAAFMQVGLHGKYRAAYYLPQVFAGMKRVFSSYVASWCISVAVLTVTVLALPLFPFVTFWAYLVFGFLFLNCAYNLGSETGRKRFARVETYFARPAD